jgi:hypothetical protein
MENGEKVTWFGQTVTKQSEVPLGSVGAMVPCFERGPFGANGYLDVIMRRPFQGDDRFVPVASVSRSYVLVQHGEIVEALKKAIEKVGFSPEALSCDLMLSTYGERMHLDVRMPSFDFNPGDGHNMALMVTCINSVDKSCALEIIMKWKRLVCSNGMERDERSDLRRIHNTAWLSADNITGYLSAQFKAAPGDLSVYKKWRETPVAAEQIETWADDVVSRKWGVHAAARTCHIARTGYDGAIEDPFEKAPPHAKRVKSEIEVPGSWAPVENIFHVSQTLSWIASHRNTIEDRLVKTREIYDILSSLVKNPHTSKE